MPDQDIVSHFENAIFGLIPEFKHNDDRLGLAVSGGPDSLALLLLSHQAFPSRIAAASVDHGLRPEARSECEYVASLCAERNIPHRILSPSIPIRGSVQAEARKVRYNLLDGWLKRENIHWLATAHHADDQLETLVMRILRGSGIDGMSAIRARRGHIIRPLLRLPKEVLLNFVNELGVEAVNDPSNRDNSFDRVRVRHALAELKGFDVGLASQSAAAIDDARTAIHWIVDELEAVHIQKNADGCSLDRFDFPNEINRRLLLKCLHICQPALSPRGSQLERIISALKKGDTVTIGDTLCEGGKKWTFSAAPKRRES